MTENIEGQEQLLTIRLDEYGVMAGRMPKCCKGLYSRNRNVSRNMVKLEQTKFGTRFVIEGPLTTPIERKPLVRVVWFIRNDETAPRLVTA